MKYLISLVLLGACAHAPTCPSSEEEPVSMCRAQAACGKGKISASIAMLFGGSNAVNMYQDCVDNNLSAQRSNAHIVDNSTNCTSTRVSSDRVVTKCR